MKPFQVLTFSICLLAGLPMALANPIFRGKNIKPTQGVENHSKTNRGVEIDFSQLDFVKTSEREPALTSKDVELLIPKNLRPTNDGMRVENEITRHFLSNLMKSPIFQRASVVKSVTKAAEKVENVAKVEVKAQAKTKVDKAPPVSHKFDLKIQALKKEAKIIYKGFIDSDITYYRGTENVVFRANKSLSDSSTLSLSHRASPEGQTQSLNYRYTW